jgi:hypothetical protein
MSKRNVAIGRLALAFAALLTVAAAAGPSRADDNWNQWNQHRDRGDHDDGRWGHGNGGWGNNWRHDNWGHNWGPGWGNNSRHYDNRYPPYVYLYPRPYFYPRPYYYDYYGSPSFNVIIPLHIH